MSALPTLILRRTPEDRTAIGTGLYNTLKSLAGGIGGALFGSILNRMLIDTPEARAAGLASEGGYVPSGPSPRPSACSPC